MATKNEETSEEIKRLKKLLNDLIINNEQSVQSSNEETSEKVTPSDHYTRLKKLLNDLIEEKDTLSQSVSSPPSKRQKVTDEQQFPKQTFANNRTLPASLQKSINVQRNSGKTKSTKTKTK